MSTGTSHKDAASQVLGHRESAGGEANNSQQTAEAVAELQRKLGYTFSDISILLRALTHATYANENPNAGAHYERLEFLGDAVLDLIAARLLFESLTGATEGELSRRRARVVRRETLARLAQELDLGAYIRLGEGQRTSGGGASHRILADSFEALVGAVFRDGGYAAADRCFYQQVERAIAATTELLDFKTRLQEVCHQQGLSSPVYRVVSVDGPDHARSYVCEVHMDNAPWGRGEATSKKRAEQQCAKVALEKLAGPEGLAS